MLIYNAENDWDVKSTLTCGKHSMIEVMDNVDKCADIVTSLGAYLCSSSVGNWLACSAS